MAIPTEDQVQKSIASWIRDYLKRTGFSQVKFAKDVGVSEPHVSNVVNGIELPGLKTLIGLEFGPGAHLNEVMRFPHDEVAKLITARHPAARTNGAVKKRAK